MVFSGSALKATLGDLNLQCVFSEALSKFLDVAGNKLDYRRYGEALLEILIAGGLLGEHSFYLSLQL